MCQQPTGYVSNRQDKAATDTFCRLDEVVAFIKNLIDVPRRYSGLLSAFGLSGFVVSGSGTQGFRSFGFSIQLGEVWGQVGEVSGFGLGGSG